uniref:Ig-like domain-containing protein n=1 Tax=Takifugu rubripes TaxID=31033 RepID=A0A3B5K1J6_TAKRU
MLLVVCSLYLSAAQGKKVRPKNRGCTATVAITSSALLLTAAADDKSVRQTPPSITKREGDALVSGIKCSHSISSYNQIYWYKQDESRALKLLGYLYTNNQNVEEDVKGKISFDGDGRSGSSLSIAAVGLKDSGVYFCCDNYDPAIFGSGTRVTVLEPGLSVTGPTVTLLPPSSRECRNQKHQKRKKTIVCVASGFYPDHVSVSWEVNGQKVTDGVATDGAALRPEGRFYRISSRLRVSAEDWFRPDSDFTSLRSRAKVRDTISPDL